jgi:hypothetical protein
MSQADNLAALATNVNSSGVLQPAGGGSGTTTSTGTGSAVLSNSPTLVTPALGTPSSGNLANCTFPTLNQNTTGSAGSVAAANITGTTLAAGVTGSSLTSVGTITSGTWSGSFGAVSGANLTSLNASNLSSGTVGTARLASGTANSTTYLRGDQTWATVSGGVTSVATGNGLSGGTITSTGTLVVACPGFNTVGSYCLVGASTTSRNSVAAGSTYAAGFGSNQVFACAVGNGSSLF